MEEQKEDVLLVYVGMRTGAKDQPVPLWCCVSEGQKDGGLLPSENEFDDAYRIYGGKAMKKYAGRVVGGIYRVPQKVGTTTVYGSEARYVGLWVDADQRMRWQASDKSAITANDLRRRQAKDGAGDLFSALAPLREQYQKTRGRDRRAALLAQLIAYVVG